jgi:hypothetical protein
MQLHGSLQDLQHGDESVTQFMQKAKALFDELAADGQPVSLEDFNLYVFRGLRGEFKDLVTSLITKAEHLSYADLHSHLLTHEFLHKSSVAIHAPLLPTSNTSPSALVAQRQTFGNSGRSRGRFNGGWRPNQFSSRGNWFTGSRSDHRSFRSSSFCFMFRNFVLIIMFILNFTLVCFMSRISTPMKSFSQVGVKMVSMP